MSRNVCAVSLFVACICTVLVAQGAPTGSPEKPSRGEQRALDALKGTINGSIVWSSSRANPTHDIWIMNADGTEKHALTSGPNVDWFSRFSPDGKKVLFTRSKIGWVSEMDAKYNDKWDLWTINSDGSDEKKVAENACWGTWRPDGESIVFARGSKVFTIELASGEETLVLDAEQAFKKNTFAQQPQMSPNGSFLAMTLRGTVRQTGIYNLEKKSWATTGEGCQINWFPSGKKVLRMNEVSYNTQVLQFEVGDDGKPVEIPRGLRIDKKFILMDLPGRRTHEYFPKIDPSETWMVWCATDRGHDHDLVDYEVFVWKLGTDTKKGPVRLTFHSGNDRWPDMYTGKKEQ